MSIRIIKSQKFNKFNPFISDNFLEIKKISAERGSLGEAGDRRMGLINVLNLLSLPKGDWAADFYGDSIVVWSKEGALYQFSCSKEGDFLNVAVEKDFDPIYTYGLLKTEINLPMFEELICENEAEFKSSLGDAIFDICINVIHDHTASFVSVLLDSIDTQSLVQITRRGWLHELISLIYNEITGANIQLQIVEGHVTVIEKGNKYLVEDSENLVVKVLNISPECEKIFSKNWKQITDEYMKRMGRKDHQNHSEEVKDVNEQITKEQNSSDEVSANNESVEQQSNHDIDQEETDRKLYISRNEGDVDNQPKETDSDEKEYEDQKIKEENNTENVIEQVDQHFENDHTTSQEETNEVAGTVQQSFQALQLDNKSVSSVTSVDFVPYKAVLSDAENKKNFDSVYADMLKQCNKEYLLQYQSKQRKWWQYTYDEYCEAIKKVCSTYVEREYEYNYTKKRLHKYDFLHDARAKQDGRFYEGLLASDMFDSAKETRYTNQLYIDAIEAGKKHDNGALVLILNKTSSPDVKKEIQNCFNKGLLSYQIFSYREKVDECKDIWRQLSICTDPKASTLLLKQMWNYGSTVFCQAQIECGYKSKSHKKQLKKLYVVKKHNENKKKRTKQAVQGKIACSTLSEEEKQELRKKLHNKIESINSATHLYALFARSNEYEKDILCEICNNKQFDLDMNEWSEVKNIKNMRCNFARSSVKNSSDEDEVVDTVKDDYYNFVYKQKWSDVSIRDFSRFGKNRKIVKKAYKTLETNKDCTDSDNVKKVINQCPLKTISSLEQLMCILERITDVSKLIPFLLLIPGAFASDGGFINSPITWLDVCVIGLLLGIGFAAYYLYTYITHIKHAHCTSPLTASEAQNLYWIIISNNTLVYLVLLCLFTALPLFYTQGWYAFLHKIFVFEVVVLIILKNPVVTLYLTDLSARLAVVYIMAQSVNADVITKEGRSYTLHVDAIIYMLCKFGALTIIVLVVVWLLYMFVKYIIKYKAQRVANKRKHKLISKNASYGQNVQNYINTAKETDQIVYVEGEIPKNYSNTKTSMIGDYLITGVVTTFQLFTTIAVGAGVAFFVGGMVIKCNGLIIQPGMYYDFNYNGAEHNFTLYDVEKVWSLSTSCRTAQALFKMEKYTRCAGAVDWCSVDDCHFERNTIYDHCEIGHTKIAECFLQKQCTIKKYYKKVVEKETIYMSRSFRYRYHYNFDGVNYTQNIESNMDVHSRVLFAIVSTTKDHSDSIVLNDQGQELHSINCYHQLINSPTEFVVVDGDVYGDIYHLCNTNGCRQHNYVNSSNYITGKKCKISGVEASCPITGDVVLTMEFSPVVKLDTNEHIEYVNAFTDEHMLNVSVCILFDTYYQNTVKINDIEFDHVGSYACHSVNKTAINHWIVVKSLSDDVEVEIQNNDVYNITKYYTNVQSRDVVVDEEDLKKTLITIGIIIGCIVVFIVLIVLIKLIIRACYIRKHTNNITLGKKTLNGGTCLLDCIISHPNYDFSYSNSKGYIFIDVNNSHATIGDADCSPIHVPLIKVYQDAMLNVKNYISFEQFQNKKFRWFWAMTEKGYNNSELVDVDKFEDEYLDMCDATRCGEMMIYVDLATRTFGAESTYQAQIISEVTGFKRVEPSEFVAEKEELSIAIQITTYPKGMVLEGLYMKCYGAVYMFEKGSVKSIDCINVADIYRRKLCIPMSMFDACGPTACLIDEHHVKMWLPYNKEWQEWHECECDAMYYKINSVKEFKQWLLAAESKLDDFSALYDQHRIKLDISKHAASTFENLVKWASDKSTSTRRGNKNKKGNFNNKQCTLTQDTFEKHVRPEVIRGTVVDHCEHYVTKDGIHFAIPTWWLSVFEQDKIHKYDSSKNLKYVLPMSTYYYTNNMVDEKWSLDREMSWYQSTFNLSDDNMKKYTYYKDYVRTLRMLNKERAIRNLTLLGEQQDIIINQIDFKKGKLVKNTVQGTFKQFDFNNRLYSGIYYNFKVKDQANCSENEVAKIFNKRIIAKDNPDATELRRMSKERQEIYIASLERINRDKVPTGVEYYQHTKNSKVDVWVDSKQNLVYEGADQMVYVDNYTYSFKLMSILKIWAYMQPPKNLKPNSSSFSFRSVLHSINKIIPMKQYVFNAKTLSNIVNQVFSELRLGQKELDEFKRCCMFFRCSDVPIDIHEIEEIYSHETDEDSLRTDIIETNRIEHIKSHLLVQELVNQNFQVVTKGHISEKCDLNSANCPARYSEWDTGYVGPFTTDILKSLFVIPNSDILAPYEGQFYVPYCKMLKSGVTRLTAFENNGRGMCVFNAYFHCDLRNDHVGCNAEHMAAYLYDTWGITTVIFGYDTKIIGNFNSNKYVFLKRERSHICFLLPSNLRNYFRVNTFIKPEGYDAAVPNQINFEAQFESFFGIVRAGRAEEHNEGEGREAAPQAVLNNQEGANRHQPIIVDVQIPIQEDVQNLGANVGEGHVERQQAGHDAAPNNNEANDDAAERSESTSSDSEDEDGYIDPENQRDNFIQDNDLNRYNIVKGADRKLYRVIGQRRIEITPGLCIDYSYMKVRRGNDMNFMMRSLTSDWPLHYFRRLCEPCEILHGQDFAWLDRYYVNVTGNCLFICDQKISRRQTSNKEIVPIVDGCYTLGAFVIPVKFYNHIIDKISNWQRHCEENPNAAQGVHILRRGRGEMLEFNNNQDDPQAPQVRVENDGVSTEEGSERRDSAESESSSEDQMRENNEDNLNRNEGERQHQLLPQRRVGERAFNMTDNFDQFMVDYFNIQPNAEPQQIVEFEKNMGFTLGVIKKIFAHMRPSLYSCDDFKNIFEMAIDYHKYTMKELPFASKHLIDYTTLGNYTGKNGITDTIENVFEYCYGKYKEEFSDFAEEKANFICESVSFSGVIFGVQVETVSLDVKPVWLGTPMLKAYQNKMVYIADFSNSIPQYSEIYKTHSNYSLNPNKRLNYFMNLQLDILAANERLVPIHVKNCCTIIYNSYNYIVWDHFKLRDSIPNYNLTKWYYPTKLGLHSISHYKVHAANNRLKRNMFVRNFRHINTLFYAEPSANSIWRDALAVYCSVAGINFRVGTFSQAEAVNDARTLVYYGDCIYYENYGKRVWDLFERYAQIPIQNEPVDRDYYNVNTHCDCGRIVQNNYVLNDVCYNCTQVYSMNISGYFSILRRINTVVDPSLQNPRVNNNPVQGHVFAPRIAFSCNFSVGQPQGPFKYLHEVNTIMVLEGDNQWRYNFKNMLTFICSTFKAKITSAFAHNVNFYVVDNTETAARKFVVSIEADCAKKLVGSLALKSILNEMTRTVLQAQTLNIGIWEGMQLAYSRHVYLGLLLQQGYGYQTNRIGNIEQLFVDCGFRAEAVTMFCDATTADSYLHELATLFMSLVKTWYVDRIITTLFVFFTKITSTERDLCQKLNGVLQFMNETKRLSYYELKLYGLIGQFMTARFGNMWGQIKEKVIKIIEAMISLFKRYILYAGVSDTIANCFADYDEGKNLPIPVAAIIYTRLSKEDKKYLNEKIPSNEFNLYEKYILYTITCQEDPYYENFRKYNFQSCGIKDWAMQHQLNEVNAIVSKDSKSALFKDLFDKINPLTEHRQIKAQFNILTSSEIKNAYANPLDVYTHASARLLEYGTTFEVTYSNVNLASIPHFVGFKIDGSTKIYGLGQDGFIVMTKTETLWVNNYHSDLLICNNKYPSIASPGSKFTFYGCEIYEQDCSNFFVKFRSYLDFNLSEINKIVPSYKNNMFSLTYTIAGSMTATSVEDFLNKFNFKKMTICCNDFIENSAVIKMQNKFLQYHKPSLTLLELLCKKEFVGKFTSDIGSMGNNEIYVRTIDKNDAYMIEYCSLYNEVTPEILRAVIKGNVWCNKAESLDKNSIIYYTDKKTNCYKKWCKYDLPKDAYNIYGFALNTQGVIYVNTFKKMGNWWNSTKYDLRKVIQCAPNGIVCALNDDMSLHSVWLLTDNNFINITQQVLGKIGFVKALSDRVDPAAPIARVEKKYSNEEIPEFCKADIYLSRTLNFTYNIPLCDLYYDGDYIHCASYNIYLNNMCSILNEIADRFSHEYTIVPLDRRPNISVHGRVVVESGLWQYDIECQWDSGFLRKNDKVIFLYKLLNPYIGLCFPHKDGISTICPNYNLCCFDTLVACVLRNDNAFKGEQDGISYFINMMVYYIGLDNLNSLIEFVRKILHGKKIVKYIPTNELHLQTCIHEGSKISFKPLSVIYRCMRDPNFKRNMKTAKEFIYSYPTRFEYLLDHWVGKQLKDQVLCAFNTLALTAPNMVIAPHAIEKPYKYTPGWVTCVISYFTDKGAEEPILDDSLVVKKDTHKINFLLNDLQVVFSQWKNKYPIVNYDHTNYATIKDLNAEMAKLAEVHLDMTSGDSNCLFLFLYYIPVVHNGYISSILHTSTTTGANTVEVQTVIKLLLLKDLCLFDYYMKTHRISVRELNKMLTNYGKSFCCAVIDLIRQYGNIRLEGEGRQLPDSADKLVDILKGLIQKDLDDDEHPCRLYTAEKRYVYHDFISSNFGRVDSKIQFVDAVEFEIELPGESSLFSEAWNKVKGFFTSKKVNEYHLLDEKEPTVTGKLMSGVILEDNEAIRDVDMLISDDSTNNSEGVFGGVDLTEKNTIEGNHRAQDDRDDPFIKTKENEENSIQGQTAQKVQIVVQSDSSDSDSEIYHAFQTVNSEDNQNLNNNSFSSESEQNTNAGNVQQNDELQQQEIPNTFGGPIVPRPGFGGMLRPRNPLSTDMYLNIAETRAARIAAIEGEIRRRNPAPEIEVDETNPIQQMYPNTPMPPNPTAQDIRAGVVQNTLDGIIHRANQMEHDLDQLRLDQSINPTDPRQAIKEDEKDGLKKSDEWKKEEKIHLSNSVEGYDLSKQLKVDKNEDHKSWTKYTMPQTELILNQKASVEAIVEGNCEETVDDFVEDLDVKIKVILKDCNNLQIGTTQKEDQKYTFNLINGTECDQFIDGTHIYELDDSEEGVKKQIDKSTFIVFGKVTLPYEHLFGGPYGIINYEEDNAIVYYSSYNSVYSDNIDNKIYNKVAYKIVPYFDNNRRCCANAVLYGIYCDEWFGILHTIKNKKNMKFRLNEQQLKAKNNYMSCAKHIKHNIPSIDMIYHPDIRSAMGIEYDPEYCQLPVVLHAKNATTKFFLELQSMKKENGELFDDIIDAIAEYYEIDPEAIHNIFPDGMRHFNIKVINKYDDEFVNKHTFFSNSSTWNHVPEENVIAVERSLKVRLYTNTVVGHISESFKTILENCVTLDDDLHIDALQVIVDNKKPKKLRNFIVGLLKGEQVVNDFQIMIKKDEVVLAKKKFCGRVICPPNNTLKTIAILLTTVLEEHLISLNHKGMSSFCCGNSNEMNYKIWRKHISKFNTPVTLCIDGAAFDAKQFAELQEIIHNKIRLLLETPAFENVQGFKEAFEALFDSTHRLSYVSSNSRLDTNYPNVKLTVEGTSVSGHPLKTTYENTVKAEAYAKTILFEAGIYGEVMCCGDDTLVVIDRSDVPSFLRAMPAVYNPFETLGQIAKALIINGKELDVSKIYLFDENNHFVRCDEQVLYDVVSQIPNNIVAEFCSCRFSLHGLVKNLNNMLLKNITYSNMPTRMVQESRAMAFSSWMCNPMVVNALRNLNDINKVRNKALLEQDLFYNQVTKNKAIIVDDLCFEAHEVLLLTVLGEMQLDRDTIMFRKMPQQLYTLVKTMFLRLNDIVFDMLLDLTNPEKFDIEELGEDKSLVYDYHLNPPQEGEFYNEVRAMKEQGQRILQPSVNYEFENEYGVIIFSNYGCQGLKVWKPKPEKKYHIQEFIEILRREIQEEFGKGASEDCIPDQYVLPDSYDGSIIGDPTNVFEYPLQTFDLANDFEEVQLESFNKKIEHFASDAEAQAKMRTFLNDTQAFRF